MKSISIARCCRDFAFRRAGVVVAATAALVGLSSPGIVSRANAQKDIGVVVSGNEVKAKPGFSFREGKGGKIEIVQQSDVQGKKAMNVVVGDVYCGCTDPNTDLFIFCSHTMDGSTVKCGTSSKCSCIPKVSIR
jgi:hypothetical protein